MQLSSFPFTITDFANVEPEIKNGETGFAEWRTLYRDEVRIRLVTYSAGYRADHWCHKGHIIFCVEGEMETLLANGTRHLLTRHQMYTVGDNSDAHRTRSEKGCVIFIVD